MNMGIEYKGGRIFYNRGVESVELEGFGSLPIQLAGWLEYDYLGKDNSGEFFKIPRNEIYDSLMDSEDSGLAKIFASALNRTQRIRFSGKSKRKVLEDLAMKWRDNPEIPVLARKFIGIIDHRGNEGALRLSIKKTRRELINNKRTEDESFKIA